MGKDSLLVILQWHDLQTLTNFIRYINRSESDVHLTPIFTDSRVTTQSLTILQRSHACHLKASHVPLSHAVPSRPLILSISLHKAWAHRLQRLPQPHCSVKHVEHSEQIAEEIHLLGNTCELLQLLGKGKRWAISGCHYVHALDNIRQWVLLNNNFGRHSAGSLLCMAWPWKSINCNLS